MLAEIKDILIITTLKDNPLFKSLLGDGSELGINIQYAIQEKPSGLTRGFCNRQRFYW